MRDMPTAVLIHGCHLQAEGWEEIVWGDPRKGRLGRVPFGVLKAAEIKAQLVVFSTGASSKDGMLEGQYTYIYMKEHFGDLLAAGNITGPDISQFRQWLGQVAQLELTSQNTREEILASARMAHAAGIERLILVSSPEHIMRCHQAALSVLGAEPELRHFLDELYPIAAHTHFKDASVDDVVIIEPPHRGDMPKVPFHKTVRRIFQFLKKPEIAFGFNEELNALIDKWQRMS